MDVLLANSINSTVDYGRLESQRYYSFAGVKFGTGSTWTINFIRMGYSVSGTAPATSARLEYSSDGGVNFAALSSLALSSSGDLNFKFSNLTFASASIIRFRIFAVGGSQGTFALTNGSFSGLEVGYADIPEPPTYVLLGIALGAMGYARRKRTKG